MKIKINHDYYIKAGSYSEEPSCVITVKAEAIENYLIHGLRHFDNQHVYIDKNRFIKEVSRELNPEFYL